MSDWSKLVLLGLNRWQERTAFKRLARDSPATGRLVMHGDQFAFAVLSSGERRVLVVALEQRPYFLQTFDVVLLGEPWVALVVDESFPEADRLQFESEVGARVDASRCLAFRAPATGAPGELADAVATYVEGLLGADYAVEDEPPPSYPDLLPAAFPACFQADVWGHGIGREPLRVDIRLG
ncbi:MAG: hypothetical protein KC766_15530 [Myxococcales bacterium]|nr:hypothetical protein [Myxococcales bacterium]